MSAAGGGIFYTFAMGDYLDLVDTEAAMKSIATEELGGLDR